MGLTRRRSRRLLRHLLRPVLSYRDAIADATRSSLDMLRACRLLAFGERMIGIRVIVEMPGWAMSFSRLEMVRPGFVNMSSAFRYSIASICAVSSIKQMIPSHTKRIVAMMADIVRRHRAVVNQPSSSVSADVDVSYFGVETKLAIAAPP
jgi:hypothetical protein